MNSDLSFIKDQNLKEILIQKENLEILEDIIIKEKEKHTQIKNGKNFVLGEIITRKGLKHILQEVIKYTKNFLDIETDQIPDIEHEIGKGIDEADAYYLYNDKKIIIPSKTISNKRDLKENFSKIYREGYIFSLVAHEYAHFLQDIFLNKTNQKIFDGSECFWIFIEGYANTFEEKISENKAKAENNAALIFYSQKENLENLIGAYTVIFSKLNRKFPSWINAFYYKYQKEEIDPYELGTALFKISELKNPTKNILKEALTGNFEVLEI